jgi:ribose transport system ATP-binding protein
METLTSEADPIAAAPPEDGAASALRVENLSKHFGGSQALSRVTIDIRRGEVHGLLGQNGSGKSTFIKILAGFHQPDPGASLLVGSERAELPLPPGAFRKLGIAFVHQHLGLVPSMTVLENLLVIEHATESRWRIHWRQQEKRAKALFGRFGLSIDPSAPVERLSSVERALFAIVRAFDQLERTSDTATRLLILDEPTPFLPAQDVQKLFALVRAIVAEGASVLFVSHDIDEVTEITDRITVLRDGRVAGSLVTRECRKSDIVELIVGRAVDLSARPPAHAHGRELLVVNSLKGRGVSDFSMRVQESEVVGLTGLIGSGYDDVVNLCFGAKQAKAGTLALDGTVHQLEAMTPHIAVRAGIVLIPGDRHTAGIVPNLSVTDNVTLPILGQFNGGWLLSRRAMRTQTRELNETFDVRPRGPDTLMSALSGGNQQKVVLSKWFQIQPRLVLLDEPTQGVDIGAREQVFGEIRKMAATGAAVVCASSDHEQLAAICDRVLVLSRGRVVASLEGAAISKTAIAEACYINQETSMRFVPS